jgi:hypothetical protein
MHRLDHRGKHLAILARAMGRAERLHRAIELGELGLDVVEPAAAVQLGAQRVARIVDAARGAVLERERARLGAAKRAAGVGIATGGRAQIARACTGADERSELVIVEHIGGHARAARTAGEAANRPRLARCARSARRHVTDRRGDRELGVRNLGRQRALIVGCEAGPLGAEPPPQRHELGRT